MGPCQIWEWEQRQTARRHPEGNVPDNKQLLLRTSTSHKELHHHSIWKASKKLIWHTIQSHCLPDSECEAEVSPWAVVTVLYRGCCVRKRVTQVWPQQHLESRGLYGCGWENTLGSVHQW